MTSAIISYSTSPSIRRVMSSMPRNTDRPHELRCPTKPTKPGGDAHITRASFSPSLCPVPRHTGDGLVGIRTASLTCAPHYGRPSFASPSLLGPLPGSRQHHVRLLVFPRFRHAELAVVPNASSHLSAKSLSLNHGSTSGTSLLMCPYLPHVQ